jgi:hypothetical protein
LNRASRFADRLYCWFPLNGQPFNASLINIQMDFTTAFFNVPRWGGTSIGMAFNGDGSSTNITTSQGMGGLGVLGRCTLAARIWIRTAPTFNRVVQLGDAAGNGVLTFLMASSTTDIDFVDPTQTVDTATGATAANTWCDIVGVYDSGVQKAMWVNGKKFTFTAPTGTATITSDSLLIGNRPDHTRAFDGFIADIGIWTYPWPDQLCMDWNNPSRKYDLYWQPNTRAYSFMSAIAAGTAGYLLVKN